MKRQTAAKTVIARLRSREQLTAESAGDFLLQIGSRSDLVEVFRKVQDLVPGSRQDLGWNKFWRDGALWSWFGNTVVSLPLRAAALELEQNESIWSGCRSLLTDLGDGKETHESGGDPICRSKLMGLGLDLNPGRDPDAESLLHRLNLDTREQPLIERWHWSKTTGLATLTDGGRFQIQRDVVLSRALDAGAAANTRDRIAFLGWVGEFEPESKVITIPAGSGSNIAAAADMLEFYGFGLRLGDRVELAAPVGGFPRLWQRLRG